MKLEAALFLLSFALPTFAHRLDEYLQATTISIEKERVQAQIRLSPGVAVFPFVMATIDSNGDGVISGAEQQVYAERVLGDLSLSVDGRLVRLQLISKNFPAALEMKEGRGSIQIDFAADVRGGGPERSLSFENHHQRPISAFLVNCLAPRGPEIRIAAQNRNYEQSHYQLSYFVSGVRSQPLSLARLSGGGWLGFVAVLLLGRFAVLRRQRRA